MTRIELNYRIHLLTPLHIGTGIGLAKMVDDTVVRAGTAKGSGVRLPCIPGSSTKGKARFRCEALANTLGLCICGERKCKRNPCIICRIFGSPYVSGHLHFSDALLVEEWQSVGRPLDDDGTSNAGVRDPFSLATIRSGNKLERATRAVAPNFLFTFEYTAEDLKYDGTVEGQVCTRTIEGLELPLPLEGWLLVVGLQTIDKIGGLRSRGLGRCHITVTKLVVDGGDNLAEDLNNLLANEEYWLGLEEYEKI
jgi:CRISPR/Cas system CSM-associated protein Csm3 (group 7 of RAMP superfamily)